MVYSSDAKTKLKLTILPSGTKSNSRIAASAEVEMLLDSGLVVTDCAVARTSASPAPQNLCLDYLEERNHLHHQKKTLYHL